jgi:transposase
MPTCEVTADQPGHARLLAVAAQRAPGRRLWALEGTGSFGAGLAAFLSARASGWSRSTGQAAPRPQRRQSDPLDAIRAGEALAHDQLATPRQRGQREALRVLHTTRSQLVQVGADARRHLKALIVTAPEPLRQALRRRSWLQQVRACAAGCAIGLGRGAGDRAGDAPDRPAAACRLRRGCRDQAATTGAHHQHGPGLLDQPGVGPISAAQVLLAWSHPGRARSEAAFAMLAGAAPIEASSGQVVCNRLNRGGDRQLKPRAAHHRHDPPAPAPCDQAYTARRTSEGKSPREIRRCLKRMVARQQPDRGLTK